MSWSGAARGTSAPIEALKPQQLWLCRCCKSSLSSQNRLWEEQKRKAVAGEASEQSGLVQRRRKALLVGGCSWGEPGGIAGWHPRYPSCADSPAQQRGGLLWAQPRHRVSPPALVSGDALSLCLLVSALLTRFAPSAGAIHQLWQPCQFQGSVMPFPTGKSTLFFFKGKEKYLPSRKAAMLPSFSPQRHLMLNPAQGQGHSVCLGFSLSPAPASQPAARGQKGCGTCSVPGQMCNAPGADVVRLPAYPRALAIAGTRQAVAA